MEPTNIQFIIALIVWILYPGYAIATGKKTKQWIINEPNKLVYVYKFTLIELLIIGAISMVPLLLGEPLDLYGLNFLSNPFWIIGLFALAFAGYWLISKMKLIKSQAQKIHDQMDVISWLLPKSPREMKYMTWVSLVAGISEEIIYRGFLFWYLSEFMPIWVAVFLANVPFALAHLTTTGLRNTFNAFLLAMIFSGVYLLTGSLFMSILLHILVDIYSGMSYYKAVQVLNNPVEK